MITIKRLLFLVVAAAWLAGCVQTKTMPGYARAGDHIVVGLGGIERNAGGASHLSPEDLSVTLTDFNGSDFSLEPRFVFKSYPDYVSQLNTFTFDGTNTLAGLTGMVPYDGGWFVVLPLTQPGEYNNPLPLAAGPATVAVSSAKLLNTGDAIEGDLDAIPIEIIPGTSAQDVDYVRQFFGYEATPNQFLIAPGDLSGVDAVGGAFLSIQYSDDSFFAEGVEPLVVPAEHNPYVQINYQVLPNGDGTGSINVTLLNPAGFTSLATAGPGASLFSHLQVKLAYFSDGTPLEAKGVFTLDGASSYYVDMNGDVLPGVTPVLTHVVDL